MDGETAEPTISVTASEEDSCEDQQQVADASWAALAAHCAKRWPEILLADESETPGPAAAAASDGASPATSSLPDCPITDADMRTIQSDVRRTRASDPFFKMPETQARVESLLTKFCAHEGLHYTQGLHELSALFALVQVNAPVGAMNDTLTLACFVAFVRRFVPYYHDCESFLSLHISLLFFRQLLLYHHPDLHNQLEEAGVSPFVYATPWFLTLFASRTPVNIVLMLWNKFMERGDVSFMPFLAVAMLVSAKASILAAGIDEANIAAVRAGVRAEEQLEAVWAAAEELQAQTPRSFSLRLSKGLRYVQEKGKMHSSSQDQEQPWSERVLSRVEKERHLVVMPGEVVANCVRARRRGARSHRRPSSSEEAEAEARALAAEPAAASAEPVPGLPQLRLLLLDVRPQDEFEAEHMPQALHFRPRCLRRLVAASHSDGRPRLERLAAALSGSIGGLIGDPGAGPVGADAPHARWADGALLGELFQALQAAAAARWGEDWLSASAGAHLVLLGGEADRAEAPGGKPPEHRLREAGAVAPLYEVLTEHLSLARISVLLGGAAALHKEAEKRGLVVQREAAGRAPPGPERDEAAAPPETPRRRESLMESARTRLQAASATADGVGGRLGGFFRSGVSAVLHELERFDRETGPSADGADPGGSVGRGPGK